MNFNKQRDDRMRQGQHKNRSRGRGRRPGGNPANRVYESNGPDVKVRGTAQHVADKYLQLARDAQASSDSVMAESYYQHAEHYLRIIAATQGALQQQNMNRRPIEMGDDEGDEDAGDLNGRNGGANPSRTAHLDPQPETMPAQSANGASKDEVPEDKVSSEAVDDDTPFGGNAPGFLTRPAAPSDTPAAPQRRGRRKAARTDAQDDGGTAAESDETVAGDAEQG